MSSPFVAFPGTGTDYLFTNDPNLVDCDTSLNYQSIGEWNVAYTNEASPYSFSGRRLSFLMSGANNVVMASEAFPVTASVVHTVSVYIEPEDAGDRTYMQVDCYDSGGGATGSIGTINDVASTPAGRHQKSGQFTPPASSVSARLRIYYRAAVGGGFTGKTLKWDSTCVREGTDGTFVVPLNVVGTLYEEKSDAALAVTLAGGVLKVGASWTGEGFYYRRYDGATNSDLLLCEFDADDVLRAIS